MANLRVVTTAENQWNQVGARGVRFDTRRGKWRAEISVDWRNVHLGYFATEAEGHAAYLAAKRVYHAIPTRDASGRIVDDNDQPPTATPDPFDDPDVVEVVVTTTVTRRRPRRAVYESMPRMFGAAKREVC